MRYALIITITCLLFVSCKKDGTGRPQLSFTSVNTTVVNNHDVIRFTLHFTDPTGNADTLLVKELVLSSCSTDDFTDTLKLSSSFFSSYKDATGDIFVPYSYNPGIYAHFFSGPGCGSNDTARFQFVLKDNAGHASDTVSSPAITIVN
jgi:hypothetical protein